MSQPDAHLPPIDTSAASPSKRFRDTLLWKAIRNFVAMFVGVLAVVQGFVFILGEGDEVKAFLLGHQKSTLLVMGYAIVVYALYVWLEEPDL